jgi:hypothetical protein
MTRGEKNRLLVAAALKDDVVIKNKRKKMKNRKLERSFSKIKNNRQRHTTMKLNRAPSYLAHVAK